MDHIYIYINITYIYIYIHYTLYIQIYLHSTLYIKVYVHYTLYIHYIYVYIYIIYMLMLPIKKGAAGAHGGGAQDRPALHTRRWSFCGGQGVVVVHQGSQLTHIDDYY